MKKYFVLAALAFGVMASCTKVNQPTEFVDPLEDGIPVPVVFQTASPSIQVKSTGAVVGEWASQPMFVYGYNKNVTDFTQAAFIDNIESAAPASGVKGGIEVINPDNREPFYYVAGNYYDFYAYMVDDAINADSTPVKEATRVYVPFTINGSQDLMIAKADQVADIAAANKVDEVAPEKAYSAYSARRGVHPNLLFKHQLTRFTFEIIAGSEGGNNILVDKIEIQSKYMGEMNVVGENRGLVNINEETTYLSLMEKGLQTTELQPLTPVSPNAFNGGVTESKAIGESLMVIPGETSYQLRITTHQDGVQTNVEPLITTLRIQDMRVDGQPVAATSFEAGASYKVKIVIYGLEEVVITAELEDWKEGGETIIDPDLL